MRRGFTAVGIIATVALAGCGGGSPTPAALTPQALPQIRTELEQSINGRLKKLDRPAKEIACVDRNIQAMGVRQVAERVVESAPVESPSKETAAQIVGSLGRGCP